MPQHVFWKRGAGPRRDREEAPVCGEEVPTGNDRFCSACVATIARMARDRAPSTAIFEVFDDSTSDPE